MCCCCRPAFPTFLSKEFLLGFFDALFAERAIDASQFPITGDSWTSVTDSGKNVTPDLAGRLVAVRACVQLIAGAIRIMPVEVVRNKGADREQVTRPPRWTTYPNRDQTWGTFTGAVMHSLLLRGNAYVGVVSRDNLGFPDEVVFIHPDDVEVRADNGRKTIYVRGQKADEYTNMNPFGDVLHLMGLSDDGLVGLSPVEDAAQSIGYGLVLEEHGNRLFSNGASSSGVLELPAGSVPTPDQLESLRKQFKRKYGSAKNAGSPIVLANGASFKPISLPNDQAQFLESRQYSDATIASLFGVPPHMVGQVERSTSWGSGIEQQGIGFVTYTLMPWITQLQDGMSLFLPRGQYVRFNTKGLLRGDAAGRANFYNSMAGNKAMTINEIRAAEDMPPLPDGDKPPPAPNESIQPEENDETGT